MQLHIASKQLAADVTVALDASGREHLVVVAKASWSIPLPGQRPRPLPPRPLVLSDEYYGQPGQSAMRYGADMVRYKPRCDVIFDACAHSPHERPVTELLAGFELGPLRKIVRVVGARSWLRGPMGSKRYRLSEPAAFNVQPLHHGSAFGGSRTYDLHGQTLCEAHLHNPAGLGFAGPNTRGKNGELHGSSAPHLEHPDKPVQQPDDMLEPHALGAIGRHWLPRRQHAGTYDDAWRRGVFPLLPEDYDEQFNNSAPLDQQMPHPSGGEAVRLINLLPGLPDVRFKLPNLQPQVRVLRVDYSHAAPTALLDTFFFETEQRRFSAVWRGSVPIRRSLQEIADVAIGPIDPLWWRDRSLGKTGRGCNGCQEPDARDPTQSQQPVTHIG